MLCIYKDSFLGFQLYNQLLTGKIDHFEALSPKQIDVAFKYSRH